MLYSGTDPDSYVTEYTLVYEEEGGGAYMKDPGARALGSGGGQRESSLLTTYWSESTLAS